MAFRRFIPNITLFLIWVWLPINTIKGDLSSYLSCLAGAMHHIMGSSLFHFLALFGVGPLFIGWKGGVLRSRRLHHIKNKIGGWWEAHTQCLIKTRSPDIKLGHNSHWIMHHIGPSHWVHRSHWTHTSHLAMHHIWPCITVRPCITLVHVWDKAPHYISC